MFTSNTHHDPTSPQTHKSAKTPRPRPVISCLECRRKKLKCDRTLPCSQCVKSGREAVCSYQDGQVPEPRETSPDQEPAPKRPRIDDGPVQISQAGPSGCASVDVQDRSSGVGLFEKLERRVAHLEDLLSDRAHGQTSHRREQASTVNGHDSQDVDSDVRTSLRAAPLSRRRIAASVFPNAAAFMRIFGSKEPGDPRIAKVVRDLRSLHDSLKQYHKRPKVPANCFSLMNLISMLPRESACLTLSELYFDNLEHCFRILHRDTFARQLRDFFQGSDPVQDPSFVVQLLAVICMGAIIGVQSECIEFLRANDGRIVEMSAVYIGEYLDSLNSKRLYTIQALQTKMLLFVLRWIKLDKHNDLWRASGDVLRHALVMDLDKDPDELPENFTPLQAEMRRRLWMTIVEEDMMLSILRNKPCMVPDYTCKSPLNVNDNELHDHGSMPKARPGDEWTDALCQNVLAQSTRDRLHGCRDLQTTKGIGYDHILAHTRAYEKILESLPPPLRFSHEDVASKAPARLMARIEMDISIRRPLMHLYTPFAQANDEHDAFSEARAGYLQSCLMLDMYQDLFDPKYSELDVERPEGYWDFFYNVYRTELHQAVSGLCLELKRISTSSQPDTPIRNSDLLKVHTYNRASLIHAVKDTLEPMIRRVGHYGSDIKELSYLTIVFNSVKTASYNSQNIIEALEELVASCRLQLERSHIPLHESPGDLPTHSSSSWTPGPGNDVSWTDLANFPFEFDYGNELNVEFS